MINWKAAIVLVFLSSLTWAASDYSCGLYKTDITTGQEDLVCSATFIKSTRAITAAHCFDFIDNGPVSHLSNRYRLKCPNRNQMIAVKAVAQHSYFYEIEKRHDLRLILSEVFGRKFDQNDIAVMLTEPLLLDQFPQLPAELSGSYTAKSCRIFGYSKRICRGESGCMRDSITLRPADTPVLPLYTGKGCDNMTGIGCYGSNSREVGPRLFSMDLERFEEGDSGAGVICDNQHASEVLAGIVLGTGFMLVNNVGVQMEFLRRFLEMSERDFLAQSTPVIPFNLRELLAIKLSTEKKIGRLAYRPNNYRVLLAQVSLSSMQVLRDLNQFLSSHRNSAEFSEILAKRKITEIEFPATTTDEWHSFYTAKGRPVLPIGTQIEKDEGTAKLWFSPETSFSEILRYLRQ